MGTSKYRNPVLHVVMADGGEWDVQILNPDMLRWERQAAKNRWDATSFQLTMLTFIAWSASRREGMVPTTVTWESFSDDLCLEVRDPSTVAVPPTLPDLGTG